MCWSYPSVRERIFIVGARLANANLDLVKQIHAALGNKNGTRIRFPSLHDGLVCDFSVKHPQKIRWKALLENG